MQDKKVIILEGREQNGQYKVQIPTAAIALVAYLKQYHQWLKGTNSARVHAIALSPEVCLSPSTKTWSNKVKHSSFSYMIPTDFHPDNYWLHQPKQTSQHHTRSIGLFIDTVQRKLFVKQISI
ncbi:hypothetical protein IV203_010950 [Nitzschia inconspicua]|uniref:Uncharacterized protein n=1 Tax=Nitzschia inconspicua TaxID=303405 RepID=A0A9K3KX24_9STRA|nr:hypothetical protein IV203_010950 [Nitzschia inconspicua]